MRIPALFLVLPAVLLAGACGPKPAQPTEPAGQPAAAGQTIEDQDLSLGGEWVQTMLDEDRKALARMRDQLDAVRREVERLDAAGPASAAEADAARARLRELLDEQDRELRKFRENAAEMRKVMGEGKP